MSSTTASGEGIHPLRNGLNLQCLKVTISLNSHALKNRRKRIYTAPMVNQRRLDRIAGFRRTIPSRPAVRPPRPHPTDISPLQYHHGHVAMASSRWHKTRAQVHCQLHPRLMVNLVGQHHSPAPPLPPRARWAATTILGENGDEQRTCRPQLGVGQYDNGEIAILICGGRCSAWLENSW